MALILIIILVVVHMANKAYSMTRKAVKEKNKEDTSVILWTMSISIKGRLSIVVAIEENTELMEDILNTYIEDINGDLDYIKIYDYYGDIKVVRRQSVNSIDVDEIKYLVDPRVK